MRSRRSLNLGLLVTGAVTLLSGYLIQVEYHMHDGMLARGTRTVWGLGYPAWAVLHQIASTLMLVIAVWHLVQNRKPLFVLLTREGAWRRQAPIFFALFAFAVVTALAAWVAGKVLDRHAIEHALVETHDKIVIPMSVLMIAHTWKRRARLLR